MGAGRTHIAGLFIFEEQMTHLVVSSSRYCQRSTCGKRGVDDGIKGGSKNYTADVPELLRRIRGRLLLEDTDTALEARSTVEEVKDSSVFPSHVATSHVTKHGFGHSRFQKVRLLSSRE
jgi:hypothetical protein